MCNYIIVEVFLLLCGVNSMRVYVVYFGPKIFSAVSFGNMLLALCVQIEMMPLQKPLQTEGIKVFSMVFLTSTFCLNFSLLHYVFAFPVDSYETPLIQLP